jgi:hypothetical protein
MVVRRRRRWCDESGLVSSGRADNRSPLFCEAIMKRFLACVVTMVVVALLGPAQSQTNVQEKSGIYLSACLSGVVCNQYGLAVGTNTTLTVPPTTLCAYITVETASVRRTSDGTSASTTVGTLFTSGTQWTDCGPLASYKFTAVSGSPTIDVEYFR